MFFNIFKYHCFHENLKIHTHTVKNATLYLRDIDPFLLIQIVANSYHASTLWQKILIQNMKTMNTSAQTVWLVVYKYSD